MAVPELPAPAILRSADETAESGEGRTGDW